MPLSIYEQESILIGQVFAFREEATKWIYPALTADKFTCSKTGQLGGKDHTYIWAAIEMCLAKKKSPNVTNVYDELNEKYGIDRSYLTSLEDRVKGYYRIHSLDYVALMELAEQVDKYGVVYQTFAFGSPYVRLLDSPTEFQEFVDNKVEDVDLWLNEYTGGFRSGVRNGPEGYESMADISVRAIDRLEQIRAGEVSMLLPIGLPTHRMNALYPYGSLVIVQGDSNMGKTSYTNLMALGTAIGLQKQNIPGCVAINSLETSAITLSWNLAAMLAGFNTQKLYQDPSTLQGDDFKRYLEWIEYVGTLPIYIDTTDMLKTSVMQYRLQGIHSSDRGPLRMLVSDYSELFGDDDAENKEQKQTLIARRHLSVARTLNSTVFLITQSTFDGSKDRIAGAHGIRYSKGIRHAADFQVEVWNPVEMRRKGIDFIVPEGLDDHHVWLLYEKTREIATPDPIALNWTGEYKRMSDPNLDIGKLNPVLFEHFMEVEEIKQTLKVEVPAVADTSVGDWSDAFGAFGD